MQMHCNRHNFAHLRNTAIVLCRRLLTALMIWASSSSYFLEYFLRFFRMSSSCSLVSMLGGRGRHMNWKNFSLGSLQQSACSTSSSSCCQNKRKKKLAQQRPQVRVLYDLELMASLQVRARHHFMTVMLSRIGFDNQNEPKCEAAAVRGWQVSVFAWLDIVSTAHWPKHIL